MNKRRELHSKADALREVGRSDEARELTEKGMEMPQQTQNQNLISLSQENFKLLEKLKQEMGLNESQIISMALEKLVVSNFVGNESTVSVNTNAPHYRQLEESMPKDELDPGYKIAIPKENNEHSLMVKGLIPMLQNKIFPVVFVVSTLDELCSSQNKQWINLDFFRDFMGKKAVNLVQILDATPNSNLQTGFPSSENKIERGLKRGWSKSRKEDERSLERKKTMNRFLDSFVGNIEHFMKKTKPTLIGAPGEWGLIEGAIEPDGSEWIRLTQKGREMPRTVGGVAGVSVLRKLLELEPEVMQKFHYNSGAITWLFRNVFQKFPLEYDAMIMMLEKGEFGGKKDEERKLGSDDLKLEFYKIQKKFLEDEDVQKNDRREVDWGKEIEKIEKNDKLISKNRANGVMNKMQEMGLFTLENRKIYKITSFGLDFRKKFSKKD